MNRVQPSIRDLISLAKKFVLRFLRSENAGPTRVAANVSWLFIDRIARLVVGFLVFAWVARYLGPSDFGLWNYALALVMLVAPLSTLGIDYIVIRELVKTPDRTNTILGTAFWIRLMGSGIAVAAMILGIMVFSLEREAAILSLILVSIYVFQSLDVIDYLFQSRVQSYRTILARGVAFFVCSGIKVLFIIMHKPLIYFVWMSWIEVVFGGGLLIFGLHRTGLRIREWKFNATLAWSFVKAGIPILITSIISIGYTRIDHILLANLLGKSAVGHYSAAVKLSECWAFIPIAIVSSTFPSIIWAKTHAPDRYRDRMQRLMNLIVFGSIVVVVGIILLSPWITRILYGSEYVEAGRILRIYCVSGIFSAMGLVSMQWLIAEGKQHILITYTTLSLLLNIALNFILIPIWGPLGAAIAYASAQLTSSFLLNATAPATRQLFLIQSKAFSDALLFKTPFAIQREAQLFFQRQNIEK